MRKIIFILSLGLALCLTAALKPQASILIYPMPEGELSSGDFVVEAASKQVPVYIAKVAPLDKKLRFKAMDDKVNSAQYFEQASFAYFDIDRAVKVSVKTPGEIHSVKILPSSLGVKATIAGDMVNFNIEPGQKLTVEVNGDIIHSLHIFANQIETDKPNPKDPNIIYYGPGIHEISRLVVRSNQTLYIAGGAILRTVISHEESKEESLPGIQQKQYQPSISLLGKNIKVKGRGIIDGSACPTHARNMIMAQESDNVTIEGVILRDASVWTLPVRSCNDVHIDDLKLIGYRANSDGIDICNSTNVLVENCFIRTLDDLVVVKTLKGRGECKNVLVRNCVLWNEVAHALSIGAEIREDISNVLFSDCDIIHDQGREWALRVYHCDAAKVSNIRFENIRIEECSKLVSLWIDKAVWTADSLRGHIDEISFKNIDAKGSPATIQLIGYGRSNMVNKVSFENITVNGSPLREDIIEKNDYVEGITIK